ncbi:hypothetical protein FGB62_125g01 [Gracilaria domingensis]|nr:hypothetical protein FGB62_125g01 [Gracilaria domingensis]
MTDMASGGVRGPGRRLVDSGGDGAVGGVRRHAHWKDGRERSDYVGEYISPDRHTPMMAEMEGMAGH